MNSQGVITSNPKEPGVLRVNGAAYAKGTKPVAGFDKHPENIAKHKGWRKENSISYQYRRFLHMSDEETRDWVKYARSKKGKKDEVNCSNAAWIAYERVRAAKSAIGLQDSKEITDRLEGKAPQNVQIRDVGDSNSILQALQTLTVQEEKEIKAMDRKLKKQAREQLPEGTVVEAEIVG